MKKIKWLVKQLFPLMYISVYSDGNGDRHIAIWRMWFGKCFNIKYMN